MSLARGRSQSSVRDVAGLLAALKSARGGETILLAPGVYSGINLRAAATFDKPVTITSADPQKRAVLTDFAIYSAKGLTFSNLEFVPLAPDLTRGGSYWAFRILSSRDIRIDRVSVHGSLDDNTSNDPSGLQFRLSNDVSVTNSEFQQLERGMLVAYTDGITASGNHVHDIRSDGFDFADVRNVKITGNTFRNFNPVGEDHPDAIQFWTKGTKNASRDIMIANNVILRGAKNYTHGIFFRDETEAMPYEHVTIANNLIVGTGYHGISITGAHGLEVTDNVLVTFSGELLTWMKIADSDNVLVSGNKFNLLHLLTSTNAVQKNNEVTRAVKDRGLRAMAEWMNANPSHSQYLRRYVTADTEGDRATLPAH